MRFKIPGLIIGITMFALTSTELACNPSSAPRAAGDPKPPAVAAASPGNTQSGMSAPEGWKKVDADGKFTFYLPPDMGDTGGSGTESLHREYTNGKMHVSFDYQPFGFLEYAQREQAFRKGFQETEMQVGGEKAFLFAYLDTDRRGRKVYNADLYVGNLPNHQVKLQMLVSSTNPAMLDIAKKIFGTIAFPRE
jgi:hypothetical protein